MNRLALFTCIAGLTIGTLTGSALAGAEDLGSGLVVLHENSSGALTMSGNSHVLIPARAVYVNSVHTQSITASGNALLDAPIVYLRGGARFTGNAQCTGDLTYRNTPYPDPLEHLAIPNGHDMPYHGSKSISGQQTATLSPGVYTNISISSHANVTFEPGTYVINSGLSVSGSPHLVGNGVTFVIQGGSISLSGQAELLFTAPMSGPLAGMAIVQPPSNTSSMSLSGGSNFVVRGTIYGPKAKLTLSGQGTLAGEGPQMGDLVVCERITLSGQGTIKIGTEEAQAISLPTLPLFD